MNDFISFNALGLFSLIILSLLLYHARRNKNSDDAVHQKTWTYALVALFIAQLFDIISYGLDGIPIDPVFSYISNIVLFTALAVCAATVSLFFEYSISFSKNDFNRLKSIFLIFIVAVVTMLLLSIPFGLVFYIDTSSNYYRGSFYVSNIILTYIPLVIVLFRAIFLHKNSNRQIKCILITGTVCTLFFCCIQIALIAPVPMIFPSITMVMLFLHLSLTNNSIYKDFLTGLKNRKGAEQYFSNIHTQDQFFSVVYFDINKFKEINDRFGHKEGDTALKAFASMLSSITRRDDLVARMGGDEFLLAAAVNDEPEVHQILDRLNQEIDYYNRVLARPYLLSVSCGISINPPGVPIDKEALLQDADQKMYQNKLEFESQKKPVSGKK